MTKSILSNHSTGSLNRVRAVSLLLLGAFVGSLLLTSAPVKAQVSDYTWSTNQTFFKVDEPIQTSRNVVDTAMSADGSKVFAVATDTFGFGSEVGSFTIPGGIFMSTDYGLTWTTLAGEISTDWKAISASADGTKLVAAEETTGYLYSSTDSGATWTQRIGGTPHSWESLAASADGTKVVAGGWGNYLYTSTDSGATWTEATSTGINYWGDVTSSADGTNLAASIGWGPPGYIYTSTDSGATWTEQTALGNQSWWSITSSADGSKLAATTGGQTDGYIYTSDDFGVTWTQQTNAGQKRWQGIAYSGDGSRLSAFDGAGPPGAGYIYTSTDGGTTWTSQTELEPTGFSTINYNYDGSRLVLVSGAGDVYMATVKVPAVKIGSSSSMLYLNNGYSKTPTQVNTSRPTISGLAYSNGQVEVEINSNPIYCNTTADTNGEWSCTLSDDLPNGEHTVYVRMTNPENGSITTVGPYYINVLSAGSRVIAPNTGLNKQTSPALLYIIGLVVLLGTTYLIISSRKFAGQHS